MVEVEKVKNGNFYSFKISTDLGCFVIEMVDNLDLYWRYKSNKNMYDIGGHDEIYITKENFLLFSLFDELYNDVKEYNVFKPNKYNDKERCVFLRNMLMEQELYNRERLFKNGRIDCHSDDFEYDVASSFVIEKLDECYKITFNKSRDISYITYSVRISNSGSRYSIFNVLFFNMYRKLCDYNPDFHQIHMEEYLYQKHLSKRKETI